MGASRRDVLKASILLPMMATAAGVDGVSQGVAERVVGGRRRRVRRLDRPRAAAARSARHAGGRVGAGQRARQLRRRDARHPRHLRRPRRSTRRWPSRAMQLWKAYDEKWDRGFFRKTGALWMFGADGAFGTASAAALRAQGLPIEELTARRRRRGSRRSLSTASPRRCGSRKRAISLRAAPASTSCERFIAEGGEYGQAARPRRAPLRFDGAPVRRIPLATAPTRSRRTPSSSRAGRGSDGCFPTWSAPGDADAAGGLLLRHAARRPRLLDPRCRCGSTTAIA